MSKPLYKKYIVDAGIIARGRTDGWSIRPSGIPPRSAGSGGGADCLVGLLCLDSVNSLFTSRVYILSYCPLPVPSRHFLFLPLPFPSSSRPFAIPYCPLPVLSCPFNRLPVPQIGTWYSNNTLVMNSTSLDLNASETLANKTLIVTTILVTVFIHSARQLVLLLFRHMMSLPPTGKPLRDAEVQLRGLPG